MVDLLDGQFELAGLVMGPMTPYFLMPGTNPWRRQAIASASGTYGYRDGGWAGAEYVPDVVVPFRIRVGEPGTWASWWDHYWPLMAAFSAVGQDGDQTLRWRQGDRTYQVFGRPRMVDPSTDVLGSGYSIVEAAFVALDPIIYDASEDEPLVMGLPKFEGGFQFPLQFPLSIPGVMVDGFAEVTNHGTSTLPLRFRIDGPVVDPRVVVVTPGRPRQSWQASTTVEADQWLEVDTHSESALANGLPTASRAGDVHGEWVTLPGRDPTGPPVTSRILFRSGVDNDEARLTVYPPFSGWGTRTRSVA